MAYYERVHPQIQEVPFDLNAEQKTQLDELRAELKTDGKFDDVTDYTLFRFLRGYSFNPQSAAKAFREYVQWRIDEKVDGVLEGSAPKHDLIKKLIPYSYHAYDNDGRPIYIEKTGKILCDALANTSLITVTEFVQSHKYGLELLMRRAHEESLKRGKRIDTFATIIDLEGLSLSHRQAIPILSACTAFDAKYYPERIGRLVVINAPWIAPYLYQLVQNFVDPVTKSRLHIVNGDPKQYLPTVIPKENLPVEYGGTCNTCQGACVPILDASEIMKELKPSGDGYESQYITYDFVKELECPDNGGTFTWFFESEGGYDIDFSIEIQTPQTGKDKQIFYKPVTRIVTSKGSYTSPIKSKLIFKWDNSYSYFTNKQIKFLVTVAKLDIQVADRQQEASAAQLAAAADGKNEAKN
jgi:hypothetical protein